MYILFFLTNVQFSAEDLLSDISYKVLFDMRINEMFQKQQRKLTSILIFWKEHLFSRFSCNFLKTSPWLQNIQTWKFKNIFGHGE